MQQLIRNFSIIAHIDHGKSTLADRILEQTGAITPREFRDQILDDMDLERERGITIKARAARLHYTPTQGSSYLFNLIDTPGHVDFMYEVSRSLVACEGVILVVDASQGVEAQTLANAALARENHLAIIPVLNKIDLASANIERCMEQLEDLLDLSSDWVVLASAKEGRGIREILDAVIERIPPPQGSAEAPLKALIFDSWFDPFQGAVVLIRVIDGMIQKGMQVRFLSTQKEHEVLALGVFTPKPEPVESLAAGEVGYLVSGIRDVREAKLGDTVVEARHAGVVVPIPGYREMKPMVFCGLYTVDSNLYKDLKEALEKLRLNDASFCYEPETSLVLGFGFRCGFLGLLHMEIIRERLEREYNLVLISTAPTVVYKVTTQKGEILQIDNPSKLPPIPQIVRFEEPYIRGTIVTGESFLGPLLQLCQERRGTQKDLQYIDTHVRMTYEMPLGEIILDFYDRLKSLSKGYASFDYENIGFRVTDLVKVDVLFNGEAVDAFSFMVDKEQAYIRSKKMVERLKEAIPKQMFEVAIQAAIGSRVIARETVGAMRKNVTAKCYGGDITRKRKLWEKQKEGKKRMKQVGKIEIPQEAFFSILKI